MVTANKQRKDVAPLSLTFDVYLTAPPFAHCRGGPATLCLSPLCLQHTNSRTTSSCLLYTCLHLLPPFCISFAFSPSICDTSFARTLGTHHSTNKRCSLIFHCCLPTSQPALPLLPLYPTPLHLSHLSCTSLYLSLSSCACSHLLCLLHTCWRMHSQSERVGGGPRGWGCCRVPAASS